MQEARRRQQREEEKRKAEEAAAKATKVGNEAGDELVAERSQAVTADDDPSTSGIVVNGNPTSEDLERHHNATSTPRTENNESSANFQFNERNEKSVEKV